MEKEIFVRISGSGNRDEIIKQLKMFLEDLENTDDEILLEGVEWETPCLFLETNDHQF